MPHRIISARYTQPIPVGQGTQPHDAPVLAAMASGPDQYRRANDDIQDGGMTAFLAEGGVIEPYEPPTVEPVEPSISPRQFAWMLAYTGLDDVWAAVEAQAKKTDRALYANLRANREAKAFLLSETLAIVNLPSVRQITEVVAPEEDLSDEAIRTAWGLAAAKNFATPGAS